MFRRVDFDDDDEQGFEAELAMLEEVEAECRNDMEEVVGEGPEAQTTSMKWSRPKVPPFDPEVDSLVFQQLDVDYFVGVLIYLFTVCSRSVRLRSVNLQCKTSICDNMSKVVKQILSVPSRLEPTMTGLQTQRHMLPIRPLAAQRPLVYVS